MPGTQDSIDLLPRLTSGGGSNRFPANQKVENIELSLGLSLNGRFGLEPERSVANNNNINNNNKRKLFRASSVTEFVNCPVDVELSLTRTCSLPPETEAEWRKRKELQSLRLLEAKRKRVEKVKSLVDGRELCRVGLMKQSSPAPARFLTQRSIGSQESGGSSGVSDMDSQPCPGKSRETSETNEHSEPNKVKCNPKTKPDKHGAYDETMPCVSTKGVGPNGKRIQGFLYSYGKAEDVRIVCVCHGSFLTPAEFVKHGGGGDVDHPLRHIIVTSLFG